MKVFRHVVILIVMLLFQHCTKPVDFDQIDNANFDATYIFTLIHSNLTNAQKDGLLDLLD